MMHKRYVYVLRSVPQPLKYYVGVSSDVSARLNMHNAGGVRYTAALRPWSVVASIEFSTEKAALDFEAYLKTGSGRAFAKRHFV
jgi:putative endonuclease